MAQTLLTLDDRELTQVAGGRYVGPTFVYIVQEGDTLPRLAQRFGTTVRVLLELNKLPDPEHFKPGVRLLIPQR
ncbi:MAG: LysM peptidoglycan-binding domain-containing protein [Oscillospiraceae bacterium]|nr:LysM peptidoglycan-binding domain-containing protein [Oscillospiraceae bacterium]